MEVEFKCAECSARNEFETENPALQIVCKSCGKEYSTVSSFTEDENILRHCGICGCRDLYVQRDFNRKVGVGIVAVGAVLAPFTKLISLFVCALIDLILYRALPAITICYRCNAIFRDFTINPKHEGFNLGINDRYRAAER